MNGKRLYVIGTNHFDLAGKERLTSALQFISPKAIALELLKDRSNVPDSYIQRMEAQLSEIIDNSGLNLNEEEKRKFIEINSILALKYGYELSASKEYVRQNPGSKLFYVDMSVFTNGLNRFEDGVVKYARSILEEVASNPEAREGLLRFIHTNRDTYFKMKQVETDETYLNSGLMFDRYKELIEIRQKGLDVGLGPFSSAINPKRDDKMSGRIRRIYTHMNSGNLCSIIGLCHGASIKDRLKDLDPIFLTLLDAAKIDE